MKVSLPDALIRVRRAAWLVAVVALSVCVAGLAVDRSAFFMAYLVGYFYWFGIAMGAVALLMVHHIVGGGWGFLGQRIWEAAASTMPLMAVLFIPVLFGIHDLYEWSHAEAIQSDPVLQHKQQYLNPIAFIVRAGVYFAIWIVLSRLLLRWSRRQDEVGEGWLTHRLQRLSGPGLVLYVLTMTFAAFDWGMSLDPHWFSSIYGLFFVVMQGLAVFAFTLILMPSLRAAPTLIEAASAGRIYDLGSLMLSFIMLWAYINLSQLLIIWSGNLPEEVTWYVYRSRGGWEYVAITLAGVGFALPFLLLLTRFTKRRLGALSVIALAILLMRFFNLLWMLKPGPHRATLSVHWLDIAAVVGLGALWLAVFLWRLEKQPLLPLHDPRVREVLAHGH